MTKTKVDKKKFKQRYDKNQACLEKLKISVTKIELVKKIFNKV